MNFKNTLEEKLKEIESIIRLKYLKENNIGVLEGLSGIALFEFYYGEYFNSEENLDLGGDIISKCVNKINNGYDLTTYSGGFSGFGWVIDHLHSEKKIEINNDSLLFGFDEILENHMIGHLKTGNYDFLHGGTGYAFYFLSRYKNTKSNELKIKYANILLGFIDLIDEISESVTENKIRWISVLNKKQKIYGYNLSLSHGMASLISFFTRLCDYDIFKPKCLPLLKRLINYIISLKNKNIENCVYPSTIQKNGKVNYVKRVSWCYGDLGLGISLLNASLLLNDQRLKSLSKEVLLNVSNRITYSTNGVIDAGVCHGSFGNSQIFSQLYKKTGDFVFKKAADFWIKDGINKATHKDGFAGYKQYIYDNNWVAECNLINGVSGIGLVIIDYLSNSILNWDECLMIN